MGQFLSKALAVVLVLVLSSGTFVAAICECAHGPEVPCECPHHSGASDEADLPPCHRAALKAKLAKKPASDSPADSSLKSKCGASPARLVQHFPGTRYLPITSAPAPTPILLDRWQRTVLEPQQQALSLDPPPPRFA